MSDDVGQGDRRSAIAERAAYYRNRIGRFFSPFDESYRAEFLAVLESKGTIAGACTALDIPPFQVRQARKDCPEFSAACDEAIFVFSQRVFDEVVRRGVEGVEEDVYTPTGKLVGTKRVYSDRLLTQLAKAVIPEFKDKTADVIVNNNTVNVTVDLSSLPAEALDALERAFEALRPKELPVLDVASDDKTEEP